MANHRQALPQEFQQLLVLITHGKLFALQEWIQSGKRLRATGVDDHRTDLLRIAVETGFHSILEELLRARGWTTEELTNALEWSFHRRRPDLSQLLMENGAQLKDLDFEIVCRTVDLSLMERFLRAGGDPSRDNAFARALSDMKARPLLRFYRQFRSEFPALDDQAALALAEAVQNKHVRWTALLAWAGADPFRPIPWSTAQTFPVDPESSTTAATSAIWGKNPEILKVLKLKPPPERAHELLDDAGYNGNVDLFRTLLKPLSKDQLNTSPRNSCPVLEKLVGRGVDKDIWSRTKTGNGDEENIQCIEMLLDAGARWHPETEDFRYERRRIVEHDGRYIVQLVRLLLYTPGAADIPSLIDLCKSQTLLSKIATVDAPLIQELKRLREETKVIVGDEVPNKETQPVAAHIPSSLRVE